MQVRLPAEWEPQGAVLVAWPHANTDWNDILEEADQCYVRLCEALTAHIPVIVLTPDHARLMPLLLNSNINIDNLRFITCQTNDTWTRDYGPIVTTSGEDNWWINDFKFNGWGLKFAADLDNMATWNMFTGGAFLGEYINRLGFVLEGGSIESDGAGNILTTSNCLLSRNRNGDLNKDEIEQKIKDFLGAHTVLWIDHGHLTGDDTDSHIDTLARLAPNDTILYVKCEDDTHPDFDCLEQMRLQLEELNKVYNGKFNLKPLPLPHPIFDENSAMLPATYANFLIINDTVFVPVYNQKDKDEQAAEIIKDTFPGYNIETVDCNTLIKQHGSLHCATMQLPSQILPF